MKDTKKWIAAIPRLLFGLILLSAFILLDATPSKAETSAQSADWLGGWANRIEFMVDHSRISGDLADFPILVHLSASSGINSADLSLLFKELGSNENRRRIAFTAADGLTECKAEIETWDTANKNAYIWVNVPRISSSSDTHLFVYFDRKHPDNVSHIGDPGSSVAADVWDSHYVLVQHLSSAPTIVDSSARQHTGQALAIPGRDSKDTVTLVGTRLGTGAYFNGESAYVRVPDHDDFSLPTTGYLTSSFWFSPTAEWTHGAELTQFLGKGLYPCEWIWGLGPYSGTDYRSYQICLYYFDPSGGAGPGAGVGMNAGIRFNLGDWLYCVARTSMTGNVISVTVYYPPGTKEKTQRTDTSYVSLRDNSRRVENRAPLDDPTYPIRIENTSSNFCIGTLENQWFTYKGILDENRLSNVFRSDSWIDASYYSETDQLVKYRLPSVLTPIGDKTVAEGAILSFVVSAVPADETITYSASSLPAGASFDSKTHTFKWTPNYEQAGIYIGVHFAITDGSSISSEDITITVLDVDRAPILNLIGAKKVTEGSSLSFAISAQDPDGDNVTYSASNLPVGASFSPSTATFSWDPARDQVGTHHHIKFSATDGLQTASEEISISVAPRSPALVYFVAAAAIAAVALTAIWVVRRRRARALVGRNRP